MNDMATTSSEKNGFTLIEMMVALLIFSMLSVAGVILLRGAVNNSEVTAESLNEMAAMQRFVSLMEADLNQVIARTYRDQNGDRTVAFAGQEDDDQSNVFLAFTSGGQSNVNDAPRSNLQRIEYRLRDQKIARLHYEMIDGGVISEPADLLSGVSGLEIRYRDKGGLWLNDWRTERLTDLPRALELQFMQNGRAYRHVFLVGTGYL